MRKSIGGVTLLLLAAATWARADSFTFVTPAGSTVGGLPVDASATFVTNANGTIDVTLTDLEANPTTIGQLLSDLQFTISFSGTAFGVPTSFGSELTVQSDGTFTIGPTVNTGWIPVFLSPGVFALNGLGAGSLGPAHLIIGPPGPGNVYSNANMSIAGNSAHNPFLNQTATFVVGVAGVTDTTTVTSATFSFGTTAGVNVAGVPTGTVPTPEPSSMVLLGTGLLATIWIGKRHLDLT
jgi:hypothetical protein